MTDQLRMIAMLSKADIWYELQKVDETCPYRNAFSVMRIPAGPDTYETDSLKEFNGYGGTTTRIYFDAGGKLIAIGAFE